MAQCLTRDRGAAGSTSLVLVQPRKPRPYLAERLLMGRKQSNLIEQNSSEKCSASWTFMDIFLPGLNISTYSWSLYNHPF